MQDLIERLRERSNYNLAHCDCDKCLEGPCVRCQDAAVQAEAAETLTTAQAEAEALRARVAELEGAEDRAWHEARELVRGTNADLCKTATSAYRVIYKGINNAVNNKQLRTLDGRVKALTERQT